MTVKDIVVEYLQTHGYDGLFSEDECACLKDDLMPCDDPNMWECCPGYKVPCVHAGDHDFDIGEEKSALEKP